MKSLTTLMQVIRLLTAMLGLIASSTWAAPSPEGSFNFPRDYFFSRARYYDGLNRHVEWIDHRLYRMNDHLEDLDHSIYHINNHLERVDHSIYHINRDIHYINHRIRHLDREVSDVADDLEMTNDTISVINHTGIIGIRINNTRGLDATASGTNTVAIGGGSIASGTSAIALGANSQALAANAVALGADSIADRPNTVSVGAVGAERQITHVAPATQGTDAVNLNQLNAWSSNVSAQMNRIKHQANAAAALAMAIAPAPYSAGRVSYRIGGATFQSQSAIGISVRSTSDDGNWSLDAGANSNSFGFGAQLGFSGFFN